MRTVRGLSVLGLLAGFGLLLGCGGAANEGGSAGDGIRKLSASKLPKLGKLSASKLPKLGDPLPHPLDGGRVTIAPPTGWGISPRDSRFLVRFQEDPHESYPTIVVKAEDESGSMRNVTRETLHDFAKQVASELKESKSQKTVIEEFEAGSFVGVNYERRGQVKRDYKTIIVERLILETIVGGRRYSIDLRTRDQDLHKYRPHAFAVAAGMKFHEEGAPAETKPEPGPSETPAEPVDEPGPDEKPPEKPDPGEPALEFEEEL
jgi:hypothetical protein